MSSGKNLLEVRDLEVEFDTYGGIVKAVRGISLELATGKCLGIVGESGCGKSVALQSVTGLIPTPPGRVTAGSAKFEDKELIGLSQKDLARIRGRQIGMIFQDPMSSLNPIMKVGEQIAEPLIHHLGMGRKQALNKAVQLMEQMRLPDAKKRLGQYPFEFSGGMLQRVMIAMSLACDPKLLIADEPTTALDVTIQAQILDLLNELRVENEMALILISHDLGVIAGLADKVAVMYAGEIVEQGTVQDIFYHSAHPYTLALKQSMPSGTEEADKSLSFIEGSPPDLFRPPKGCGFFARCDHAMKVCRDNNPSLIQTGPDHHSRCWLNHSLSSSKEQGTMDEVQP